MPSANVNDINIKYEHREMFILLDVYIKKKQNTEHKK